MPKCVHCGAEIEIVDRIGRLEECPQCGRYLHSCVQCRFHDRSYHNQCMENQAPQISDREDANFCEFFQIGRNVEGENKKIDEAKKRLDSLFGKGK